MQAHGLQPPPSVLRADSSLPEQPGSAKMVSLDLLLGAGAANSTPATPRDADTLLQVRCRLRRCRRRPCWREGPGLACPALFPDGPCPCPA